MEISNQLSDIFQMVLNRPDLSLMPESSADDIPEWDSLAHIQIIFAIEEEFNIKFSNRELENLSNVGDLQRLINGNTIK